MLFWYKRLVYWCEKNLHSLQETWHSVTIQIFRTSLQNKLWAVASCSLFCPCVSYRCRHTQTHTLLHYSTETKRLRAAVAIGKHAPGKGSGRQLRAWIHVSLNIYLYLYIFSGSGGRGGGKLISLQPASSGT